MLGGDDDDLLEVSEVGEEGFGSEQVSAADDDVPLGIRLRDFVANPHLRVRNPAHDHRDQTRYVPLRRRATLCEAKKSGNKRDFSY